MNPHIIFKCKFVQSTWLEKESLKSTYYGVIENGWMTTSIFHDWFQKFVYKVEVRPILFLFDGHLTHLSAATVELALAEIISLVKLPAHCADVLQLLDVSCSSSPKAYYEKFLTELVHRSGCYQNLTRSDFCNMIASIWEKRSYSRKRDFRI